MASPSADLARTPRLDSLTSLRWWAALGVFVFHIRNVVPLPGVVGELARYGNFGVAFFFVLSGFVLTWSWRREVGIGTFYWRRFARIYPLHLITLLLAIPVFYSFAPDPAHTWVKPFDVAVLGLSFVLLQGWSRDPAILFSGNPASWTLTVEAFFYALHPFIMKAMGRISGRTAMIAAGGVLLASVAARFVMVAQPAGVAPDLPWPVLRVNEFLIGMCLAWAIRSGWRPRIPVWIPFALIAAYVLLPKALDRMTGSRIDPAIAPFVSEIMVALFAILICAFAVADLEGRTRLSRSTPLVRLGEWSYAFYLIHATLIYAVLALFGRQHGLWGVGWIIVLLTASIVCAWALHRLVEHPIERHLRAWQNALVAKRRARAASGVSGATTTRDDRAVVTEPGGETS